MHFPLHLLKKLKPQKESTEEEEKDIPLSATQIEIENNEIILCFENGLSVKICNAFPGIKDGIVSVRIFTPTKDITHRFKGVMRWSKGTNSPTELVRLLHIIANFPNVYTVNEIPDSCFNFESRL